MFSNELLPDKFMNLVFRKKTNKLFCLKIKVEQIQNKFLFAFKVIYCFAGRVCVLTICVNNYLIRISVTFRNNIFINIHKTIHCFTKIFI